MKAIFAVSALAAAISAQAMAADTEATTTFEGEVSVTYTLGDTAEGSTDLSSEMSVANGPFSATVSMGAGDDDGDLALSISDVMYDNGTLSFGQLGNIYSDALVTGNTGDEDHNFAGSQFSIDDGFKQDAAVQYTNADLGLKVQVGGYAGDGFVRSYTELATPAVVSGGVFDQDITDVYKESIDHSQLNIQAAFEQSVDGVGTAKLSGAYTHYLDHEASGKEEIVCGSWVGSTETWCFDTDAYDENNATKASGLGLIYAGFESEKLADIATVKVGYRHATLGIDSAATTVTLVDYTAAATPNDAAKSTTGTTEDVEGATGVPGMLAFGVDADVAGAMIAVNTTSILMPTWEAKDEVAAGLDSLKVETDMITEIDLSVSYEVSGVSLMAQYVMNDLVVGDASSSSAGGKVTATTGATTVVTETSGTQINTMKFEAGYTVAGVALTGSYEAASWTQEAAKVDGVAGTKGARDGKTYSVVALGAEYALEDGLTVTADYSNGSLENSTTGSSISAGLSYEF
jgi:hypothetical protein